MSKKFYLTTPIYYVNDKPHIGHAYTTIAADTLARYHEMKGEEVFFLTGTDENSQKNVQAAEKKGFKDIKKYIDEMSSIWQMTWDNLGLINNDFIRTTEERHKKGVEKFFAAVHKKGDIYKGFYEGYYCVGCEAFVTKSDLVDGKCPIHKTAPEVIKEENYFFRASRYKDNLLKYIEANPEFIQPPERRHEIINYIKDHFEDISISRQSMKWGIPLPIDEKQAIYVWFDALINYLTGVGYGWDEAKFKKYWPADLHLVGKDIIKFHCALWPAMLLSAGLELPRRVFAHGFFTINGEKISKSLGNTIDPVELVRKYSMDTLRYFLLKEITFGHDGDFSEERLKERYNSDLANGLGNLVARTLAMTEKYFTSKVPKNKVDPSKLLAFDLKGDWGRYDYFMDQLKFDEALEVAWEDIRAADGYVDKEKPWELAKAGDTDNLAQVIYNLLEMIRHIAWMIAPFMPETSDKILEQLGFDVLKEKEKPFEELRKWGLLISGQQIKKGEVLFPRLI
jgi:methionyl-tRNA synthetase